MPLAKLAPCGIDCAACPAFLATRSGDRTRLEEVLKTWTANPEMTVDDLLCDGCHGERVSKDCRVCWIKDCAREREVETCAECRQYPCAALETEWSEWHVTDPVAARTRLDARRTSRTL
jgi:hypothetical protein